MNGIATLLNPAYIDLSSSGGAPALTDDMGVSIVVFRKILTPETCLQNPHSQKRSLFLKYGPRGWPRISKCYPKSRTEDHCTRILKGSRGDCRLEKELFGHGVLGKAITRAVGVRPERRYDDDFRAFGYQFSEGFREGQIPADQDAHRANGRLNHLVWSTG